MSKAKARSSDDAGGGSLADNAAALPEDLDRLRGQLVPFDLHFFQETASTNTAAANLLDKGRLKLPALVVAGHQTAGRGQRGRTWFSARASLAATFVLPICPGRPIHHLPLLVGLAVREALAGLVGEIGLKLKWPNDVLLSGRKLAGILCERKNGADIIGVGVNIRHDPGEVPADLQGSIIALDDSTDAAARDRNSSPCGRGGREVSPRAERPERAVHESAQPPCPGRWQVLLCVARSLRQTLLETPAADSWQCALDEWPAHDALLGRELQIDTPQGVLAGTASGIDADGRLCLLSADGREHAVISGSVRPIL